MDTAQRSDDGWRTITTGPRDGRVVCVYAGADANCVALARWDSIGRSWVRPDYPWPCIDGVTHWRPLPQPPARRARQAYSAQNMATVAHSDTITPRGTP